MKPRQLLTDDERTRYEWQLCVEDFGVEGQERLKNAAVLVTRVGGVGGVVAYELAAAGVGRLVLAHAGNIRLNDLNRQLLMTSEAIGTPRVACAARRLRELNPLIEIETVAENTSEDNVARLVGGVDVIVDCAPLFRERLLLNREAVRQNKPLVECAMYDLDAQITSIMPGQTPCLACLVPVEPLEWQREFPVFGAVAAVIGSLGAMEAIKLLAQLGEPLLGRMLLCDLRSMSFRQTHLQRRPDCRVCGHLGP